VFVHDFEKVKFQDFEHGARTAPSTINERLRLRSMHSLGSFNVYLHAHLLPEPGLDVGSRGVELERVALAGEKGWQTVGIYW
jgi:hypothetical protein